MVNDGHNERECPSGRSVSRPAIVTLQVPVMPSASTSGTHFRIAIVGGGIGGLFTALCIHHHVQNSRVQIDVYEQAAQYREIGAGVGIGPNAAKLFHEIGIGHQLNKISGWRNGVWISFRRFDNGDDVITVPSVETETVRNTPVSRSELLDLLKDTIQRPQRSLASYQQMLFLRRRSSTNMSKYISRMVQLLLQTL